MASGRGTANVEEPPHYDNFMFSSSGELGANNESLVSDIDAIQVEVEKLRKSASQLDRSKEKLTKALTDVAERSNKTALSAGHQEEINASINQVMMRLLSVTINVNIPRTPSQEEAYSKVKHMITELEKHVETGLQDGRRLLESYLNACSSEPTGTVDCKFQNVILSCTIDDQRQVRAMLSSLLKSYDEFHEQLLDAIRKETGDIS